MKAFTGTNIVRLVQIQHVIQGVKQNHVHILNNLEKIFPYETPENWLGKHDITSDNVNNLNNSSYPALIGHDAKTKLDYWKGMPLGISSNPQLSMGKPSKFIFSK